MKLCLYSYEKRAGAFASGPPTAFLFVSADQLGSDWDLKRWQDHMHAGCMETLAKVNPVLRSGLEKQYAIQRELFASKDQAQAE